MLAIIALSLGVATDILTAASLSYFLHRMRTGYKRYVFVPSSCFPEVQLRQVRYAHQSPHPILRQYRHVNKVNII
jgi:hypothetical protein